MGSKKCTVFDDSHIILFSQSPRSKETWLMELLNKTRYELCDTGGNRSSVVGGEFRYSLLDGFEKNASRHIVARLVGQTLIRREILDEMSPLTLYWLQKESLT